MKLRAYAKLNLTLDITGRRADGYHLIDSVMQSVSLYDTVTVEKSPKIVVSSSDSSLCGENNIAFSAARLFFEKTGLSGGAEIFIEKNIPYPAGLGGGSADAAAVLKGLNALYGAGLSENELRALSLGIGADIPFCISGGTARVGGIGEKIKKIPFIGERWFVTANAGTKKSTAQMYSRLDAAVNSPYVPVRALYTPKFIRMLAGGGADAALRCCGNAFMFAYRTSPVFGLLRENGARTVSLSGSGPAAFGVFESKKAAESAALRISAALRPLPCGARTSERNLNKIRKIVNPLFGYL